MMFLSGGRAVIRASHIAAHVANGLCASTRLPIERLLREMCAAKGQREVEHCVACLGGVREPTRAEHPSSRYVLMEDASDEQR